MNTTITTSSRTAVPLPLALQLDAVVSGANGLAYLAGASVLDGLLGLPAAPMRAVGAFLLVYAAAVGFVGTRRPVPAAGAWAVVAANELWVLASVVAVLAGLGSPTTTGSVWMVLQAVAVGGFAAVQWNALRR